MPAIVAMACLALLASTFARGQGIDVSAMWDFSRPEASEQRFREALASAHGDQALVLRTEIARSYGLRKDFAKAREMLRAMEPLLADAGPEARARWSLELGRTYASAAHPPGSVTEDDRREARRAFAAALEVATAARLDGLAVDAIHMFAFVDTAPAEQLLWARRALEVVEKSSQPDARRWEASIRNNLGYALHQLGRHEEALAQFERVVELRREAKNPAALAVARWMVAWALRSLGRLDEALAMQLELDRELQASGRTDVHVLEELEILYRARGDEARAGEVANRRKMAQGRAG